jgi:LPS sulfotransferase NodH
LEVILAPIPFVILCTQRTGSTHLAYLLEQHRQIGQYHEVFRDGFRFRAFARGRRAKDTDNGKEFAKWIFGVNGSHLKAVGFKLMYHHARSAPLSFVWDLLESLSDLRVIHLTRSNLLEVLVSHRAAEICGHWHLPATAQASHYAEVIAARRTKITLSASDCATYFEKVESNQAWALERLRAATMFSIDYEQLYREQKSCIDHLCDVLGVTRFAPRPVIVKMENYPMSKRVANYYDLKEAFAGSRFASFFLD